MFNDVPQIHVTDDTIETTGPDMDAIETTGTIQTADGKEVTVRMRVDFPLHKGLLAVQFLDQLQYSLPSVVGELAMRGDQSCRDHLNKDTK